MSRQTQPLLRLDFGKQRKMKDYIKTGFKKLDQKINGFRKGEIVAIGSRPTMGLRKFQYGMISNMVEQKQPVLHISMENSKVVFVEGTGLGRKIAKITENLTPTITGLEAIISDELKENEFEVLALDYVSNCDQQKLAEMLTGLKTAAKKFNLAIIFGTGLEEYDWQSNKLSPRPALADFAFSKILLDCIDTVIALHRPAYYYAEDEMKYGKSYGSKTELIVLKTANGKTGIVEIKFDIDALKFTNQQLPYRRFCCLNLYLYIKHEIKQEH